MTPAGPPAGGGATRSSDRFVEAALDLFSEHGYAGTSLQMIGDRLGVTKAAVTYHFRSKAELLDELVGPFLAELSEFLESVEAMEDPEQRRHAGLPAYTDLLLRHRRVLGWLSRDVTVLTSEKFAPVLAEVAARRDRTFAVTSGPLARLWGSAISAAMLDAVKNAPRELDDAFVRAQVEQIGEVLVAGAEAAHAAMGLSIC